MDGNGHGWNGLERSEKVQNEVERNKNVGHVTFSVINEGITVKLIFFELKIFLEVNDRDHPSRLWTVTVTVETVTVTVTVMDGHGHGHGDGRSRSRWWTVETVWNGTERSGTVRNDLERSEKFGHGHVTITSRSRHVFRY